MKKSYLAFLFFLTVTVGVSQVITPFSIASQFTQKGGIRFVANTVVTCSGPGCAAGRVEVPPAGTSTDNGFTAAYVDIDADGTTFSSSSDSLTLPLCSEISWAGLYWGGEMTNAGANYATRNQVKLKVNNGTYLNLTADNLQDNNIGFDTYHCFKDVTPIVQAAGTNARFTVANVAARVGGTNRFGGWSIVIIYKNDLQPMRNLTVFNGLSNVSGGNPITDITVSGFLTPLSGPVTFELGAITYDGDRSSTGDQLMFNGGSGFVNISDAVNPLNDIFNSTYSYNGVQKTTPFINPGYTNSLGFDADIFVPNNAAKNYIGNSATSATMRMTTGGETFLTQVATMAIDVYEPDLRSAVRVVDLNGGSVLPGDILEYTVVGKNIGSDPSVNTFITDTLEYNAVYVPGSLSVTYGPNAGAKTDAAGDDQFEYIAAQRVIRVRVGTGANAVSGGQVNNSSLGIDSTQFKFRAMATTDCIVLQCDNIINNRAYIFGTGNVSGNTWSNGSNPGIFDINGCPIPGTTATPISAASCLPPSAGSNSPVCTGSTISLTSSPSSSVATYSWTGPGGFVSTAANPNRANATVAMAGTYTCVISIPSSSCSYTVTTVVVVNVRPATPAPSSNTPVCTGNTINLSTAAVAGATYSWTGPSAFASALQNPTRPNATVAMAGTYSVTVTANGCTSAVGTTAVVVNATPATPAASSNTPVCTGNTINLSTPAVAGATYSWTGPSAFASALQNPTRPNATVAMAGTYSVTVTTNGCTSAVGTTAVVVNTTPATPTASSNTPVCTGNTINLSTPAVAGATYSWTGPNSFASAVQNPAITNATVAMAGTYSVTVTTNGCTSAVGTTAVVVNTTPATPAPSSNTPVCTGNTINLSTPAVAGATYSWTGPNSFASSVQNPSITNATVAMAGTYSVTVTTNGCTSAVGTTAVVVNATPATPAASSNTPVCTGNTINLSTPAVAGATYSWTGPNSFASSVQNPSITNAAVAMAGTYSVTVTTNGCTSAVGTTAVVVNATPATPAASSNTPVCTGNTINLSTPAVAGATYSWTGPSSFASSVQNPSRTNATVVMAGTYSVTVTTNGCTSAVGTTAVVVNATPAMPTASSNTPVCTGNTINLSTPAVAGATYSWTGPNSFASAVQNPAITNATVAMAGTYSVTVTTNGCTSAIGTTAVVVNTTPATPTASSNTPVCTGNTINLSTPAVAGATYSWTGPNSFASSVQNPSITNATVAMAGTYSVTVTTNGCTSAFGTTAVVVNTTPATPTASSNTPVCTGNTINLSTPAVAGATYSWTGPSAFASALQNPTRPNATVAMAGTYSVTVTTNGCTSAVGTTAVVVNATPATPAASSNTPVCTGNTINLSTPAVAGATYSWTGPNSYASSVQNPSITNATIAMAGTYSVTVTTNGCTSAVGTTAVVINAVPATPTASSNSPVCPGLTVNLSTPAVAGATYSWTGPNAFASSVQNPSITNATAAMAGTYSVTVTTNGCTSVAGTTAVVISCAPVADNDNGGTLTEDGTNGTVNIITNDTDADGDPSVPTNGAGQFSVDMDPSSGGIQTTFTDATGTWTYNTTTGEVTFDPANDYNGTAAITYTLCDPSAACDNATITFSVSPANDAPVANDDNGGTITEDGANGTVSILTNDTDIDGNPTAPTNGAGQFTVDLDPSTAGLQTTVTDANGTWTYDPVTGIVTLDPINNYNGTASITYQLCDAGALCDDAVITFSVSPSNDAPLAGPVVAVTPMNTPVGVNVGANCTDPENDPLTYTYNTAGLPVGTVVTITGNGSIVVTPPTGYTGPISIPYTVCDQSIYPVTSLCDNEVITINVIDTTGAPNAAPVANNDGAVTQPNTPVNVNPLANDFDVNGDGLTVTVPAAGLPTNGTAVVNPDGTVTYTPNSGFIGNDTITYVICDNGTPSACDTADIIVTISPVLDQPNASPIAVNDFTSTSEDMPVTVPVKNNDSDPNGGILGTPTVIGNPTNGTAVVNPDGTITYTPNNNFNGTDTLTYVVCDNGTPSACDTAEVIVTVNPTNDAPLAGPVVAVTPMNTPVGVNVGANCTDPENDPLTYTYNTAGLPAGTVVTVTGNGSIVVTPPTGYTGPISIPYTVCDQSIYPVTSLCDNEVITINVIDTTGAPNAAPVANNDGAVTQPNTPVNVNPLANDFDVNGDGLTVTVPAAGLPTNGTAVVNPDGTVTYTPNSGFIGNDTITYVICDNGTPSACDTADIIVTISPVLDQPNASPIAVNDFTSTSEDMPVTVSVKNNDSDPNGGVLGTPTIFTTPNHGTAVVNPDGTITYTPNNNFNGTDTLTYVVCDNGTPSACDTAEVIVTVNPTNDAPLAGPVVAVTPMNTPVGVNVGANCTDPENDPLTYTYNTAGLPAGTVVTVTGNGSIVVTPPAGYTGPISIPYTVCDQSIYPVTSLCDNEVITINVIDTTGAPNAAPVANNDGAVTQPNTPVNVNPLANDFDVNGDGLTVTVPAAGLPTNGTAVVNPDGTVTYTPNSGFIGNDTITYVICDNGTPSVCDTADIIVTISPVLDQPNASPIAVNDFTSTSEDMPVTVPVKNNDSDPNGGILGTPTVIGNPTNGTAVVNPDGTITYTPNNNFNGTDTLTYVVCDNGTPSACDTAEVIVTIVPVNDAPVITDINTTVAAGTTVPVNVAAGASDPDGDALSYTYGTPTGVPVTVTVTGNGTIIVTPVSATDTGIVVIPVTVCDNGTPVLCDNATITIHFVSDSTLAATNYPPQAVNDLTSTNPNTPVVVNVKGNDSDPNGTGSLGTPTIITTPTNGTAVVNPDGTITYTPNNGFTGNDTLTYVVCDNGTPSLCDTAMVVVSVINGVIPNHPPVATDDYPTVTGSIPTTIPVKNNDSDPDGNPLGNPTIITPPTNGTAVVNPDGTITYTSNSGFVGNDTLEYVICDNGTPSMCDTATVVINVIPGNHAPVITDVNTTVTAGTVVPVNVAAGTSDPDGDVLTYTYGTPTGVPVVVTVTGNGTIIVTPVNPSDTGYVTIPVTVCDDGSTLPVLCDNGTITIHFVSDSTLANTNFPPQAVNDLTSTNPNTPVVVNVKGNDSDPNGTGSLGTPTIITPPTNGTAVVNPDGTITYTPNNGFTGNDTLTYVVCDNGTPSLCDTAMVVVSVINGVIPNQPPVATDDYPSTNQNTPVVIGVKNNDSDPDGNVLGVPTIITPPTNGTAVINPDGTITYTPNNGYTGNDTLVYVICDAGTPSMCDTATVVINVIPVNGAPVITDINTTVAAGTTVPVNVAAGTSDPDGDALTYTYGTPTGLPVVVTVTGNGTIIVTPVNATDTGIVVIPVTVCDNGTPPLCDNGTITIHFVSDSTLTNTNFPPQAVNDLTSTNPNTPVVVNVKGNDSDPNGNGSLGTPTIIGVPTNGTAVVNPDGTITYTPNNGFTGNDTLTYVVCDNGTPSLCDTAMVVVSVINGTIPNQPPVATDDYPSTNENTPVVIGVKNNDSDPDGNVLGTPTIINTPGNGTAVVNPDGTITYTPNAGFTGNDTIVYVICDNGTPAMCDTATVVINVIPVNGSPVITDVLITVAAGTIVPVNVAAGTSDPDGDPLTYTYGTPTGVPVVVTVTGNGTIVVTPVNATDTGFVVIPVTVCDNEVPPLCDQGTITIHFVSDSTLTNTNFPPQAVNDLASTNPGTPVVINVKGNDSDPNGNGTIGLPAIIGNPTNGTAVVNPDGTITYTPNSGFTGNDTLVYVICDNGTPSLCDTAMVVISVINGTIPNQPPVATDDYTSTSENTPVIIGVKNNDSDPDGNVLGTPTIITNPANGTAVVNADGTITYTPNTGFTGNDTLVYVICDGGTPSMCDTATVVITVIPGTITVTNENVGGISGTPITGNVTGNDNPGGLTVGNVVLNPQHGTFTVTPTGGFTYTPNSGFSGYDTVIVQVCSGTNCVNDTIFITVRPDIENESISVTAGSTTNGTIANNDSGTGLTYGTTPVSGPAHGTIVINSNGTYTYTANSGYTGTDMVVVTVCDASVPPLCSTDTLFIIINEGISVLVVPEGFSPNNDGINDVLVVNGIENFPENTMRIFNRWGNMIFEAEHYDNSNVVWTGTSTGDLTVGGEKAPEATYFYILTYKDKNGDDQKTVGYIYLNRNGQ